MILQALPAGEHRMREFEVLRINLGNIPSSIFSGNAV